MVRYRFQQGIKYGARLLRVVKRPIENSPESGLQLLRLECEIFTIDARKRVLSSVGAVACRDLVVGPAADTFRDSSLIAYAHALRLREPEDPAAWLRLSRRKLWLEIVFGTVGESDLRNSFETVFPLDPAGWTVKEYGYELDKDWVTVSQAARNLKTSESSIRRRIRELEPVWGSQLLWRTRGGHRRIKLSLLRNLWTESSPAARRTARTDLVSKLPKAGALAPSSVQCGGG